MQLIKNKCKKVKIPYKIIKTSIQKFKNTCEVAKNTKQ